MSIHSLSSLEEQSSKKGWDGNVFALLTVCPSYSRQDKRTFIFCNVSDLSFFSRDNPCTPQLDLAGALRREKRASGSQESRQLSHMLTCMPRSCPRKTVTGQASCASVPSRPIKGEREASVLGGAGLAVRSMHPSPDEGRGEPSDALSPQGNTSCFPSRACWLAP